jgi:hypothetical protein
MIAWLLCSCGSASGVPADANAEASVAEGVTSAPGLPVPTTTPEPIATATFPVTTVVAIASGGYEHTEVGAATTVAEPCPADWQPGADDHDKMQAEVERQPTLSHPVPHRRNWPTSTPNASRISCRVGGGGSAAICNTPYVGDAHVSADR